MSRITWACLTLCMVSILFQWGAGAVLFAACATVYEIGRTHAH